RSRSSRLMLAQTTHFFAFLTLVSFPFVILEEGRGEFVFICWLRGLDVLVEAVPASGYLDWCNQAASMVLVADVIDRKEVERMQFLSQGPLQKALLVSNCLSDSSHSHCSTSQLCVIKKHRFAVWHCYTWELLAEGHW
uniref:Uncharacterized protein n=1 Tax=Coturnix japonica TaxID=93934 RepID=A0A8C2TWY4_COTJA